MTAAARTPFAISDGVLAGWHPVDLLALAMNSALDRSGTDQSAVDQVIVGCNEPVGAQGCDMARAAILAADWPDRIHGLVVDAGETSGSSAIHLGAALITTGEADTVCVAGVSSASTVQPGAAALGRTYGRPWGEGPARRVADRGGLLPAPRASETAAAALGISRAEQDDWARNSHLRRVGMSVLPSVVAVDARPGRSVAVQRGSPIKEDVVRSLAPSLSDLPPIFDDDGSVTSASFAPAADGAAVILLSREASSPVAHLIGSGRAAGDPLDPIGGVMDALEISLRTARLRRNQISRWEIAEPTAAAGLLACRAIEIHAEEANPDGGALAIGDAGAAEDLRLSADGIISVTAGSHVAAVMTGPTGSAVTIWQRL